MNSAHWLIAVTAGRWQMHGIQQAQAAGLMVLAIDADPNAPGLSQADASLCMPLHDHAEVVGAVRALGKPYAGVVSFASEMGMRLAAHLRSEFGLPGPNLELTLCLLNKAYQRRAWDAAKVPGPQWRAFTDPKIALDALQHITFPCIIKPCDSSGSRGVTKLESVQDDLVKAVERAFAFSLTSEVLVESFMEGTEFTVETFAEGGRSHILAVTEKKKVDGTRGTVARELASPQRPQWVIDQIGQTVLAAYAAIGYRQGPGHAEVILGLDNSVGLIEVAGRGGGFMVFDRLVPAISGFNIARATALQAVGLPVDAISHERKSAVLRFFPSRPGLLLNVEGIDEACKIHGVEAESFVKAGDRLQSAMADGDRLGYILAVGSSPEVAQALADRAESCIFFNIENPN